MSNSRKQSMLDKWANTINERSAIEDFLDWITEDGHREPRFNSGREAALDKYFEIDRTQLELERRSLLNGEFK